jgi:hypothetical protein
MTKEEAKKMLFQACANMKLTLDDHRVLQQAIILLSDEEKDKKIEVEK